MVQDATSCQSVRQVSGYSLTLDQYKCGGIGHDEIRNIKVLSDMPGRWKGSLQAPSLHRWCVRLGVDANTLGVFDFLVPTGGKVMHLVDLHD